MNYYLAVLKKYAVFQGRARRKVYWMFVLFNFTIGLVLGFINGITKNQLGILTTLYTLAIVIPSIAVGVRRLHDTNRSGWWFLIVLIPFIGAIVLLVFMVSNGQPGENQYGSDPRAVAV